MKEVKDEVVNEIELTEDEILNWDEEPERVSTLEHLKGIGDNLKDDAGRFWNSKAMKAVRKGTKITLKGAAIATAIVTGVAVGKQILKKDESPLLDAPEGDIVEGDFSVEESYEGDSTETETETTFEETNENNDEM